MNNIISKPDAPKYMLQQFPELFQHISRGVFILEAVEGGSDFTFKNFNLIAERFNREEIIGKKMTELFVEIKESSFFETIFDVWKSSESRHNSGFSYEDNGVIRWKEYFVYKLYSGEIVVAFNDTMERKGADNIQSQLLTKLEQVNRELNEFAYIVSHDLKAPLRGIKTLAGWITTDYADKLDEEGKEQLKLLSSRVDRMHNLIEGILQYSRAGHRKENKVQIDLNELVDNVIDSFSPLEKITVTVENKLPIIECEQTLTMELFQNLVSNTIKYMDKPQGFIKIGCVEENGFWKFSIADNGMGIDEKYFEKIFQIFQTLIPRDQFESTGVGLTVAKKIVELHGGTIWVESEPGVGSTFFFTLPANKTEV